MQRHALLCYHVCTAVHHNLNSSVLWMRAKPTTHVWIVASIWTGKWNVNGVYNITYWRFFNLHLHYVFILLCVIENVFALIIFLKSWSSKLAISQFYYLKMYPHFIGWHGICVISWRTEMCSGFQAAWCLRVHSFVDLHVQAHMCVVTIIQNL
jgi:hypothetical protein